MLRFLFGLAALFITLPAMAQTGSIKGKVTDALTNEPIILATVALQDGSGGVVTAEDGMFAIDDLAPGLYALTFSYLGYESQSVFEIQVTSARPVWLDIALQPASALLEEVVVRTAPFRKTGESPLSLRTIGAAEIQRNPGGNRDISRVVQVLPGVTRVASFRNDLIIRGGAPNENRFYLDDVEVPVINHFATQGASGGPVGMLNVNFIREVDFHSSAFPANRGNALSSLIQFRQTDGRDDRIGGTFMIGATDIGATLEGPISDQTTFLISARRSYLQFLFAALELPFLPTYNDFQVKVRHRFNQQNEIQFIGLGAFDQFRLNLDANKTENQQFLLANLPETPQWNYTNGLVYKHYAKRGFWTLVLSRNMLRNEATKYAGNDDSSPENLILKYRSEEMENKFRTEYTGTVGAYRFNAGLAYEYVRYTNRTFNRIFTPDGPRTLDFSSRLDFHKYGFFGAVNRSFMDERLKLSAGIRVDGNSYSGQMAAPWDQISPRLALAWNFIGPFSLNASLGRYFQLPPYTVMGFRQDGRLINRDNGIRYIQGNHAVAGLEYNTTTNSRLTAEVYLKTYDHYPFLLRDSLTLANLGGDFGVIGNEPAVSQSRGRTYGLELLFQQRLYKGFYGIASYTLGWSTFEDRRGKLVPSAWDARHIINLTTGVKFGRHWEAGVNWRFQSGLPYTPFSDRSSLVQSWDVNGRGIPDYERLNTLRTSPINSLDIRIDKKWYFRRWSLNVYVDVQNILANSVSFPQLILDRPLDSDNQPVGNPVIINPEAPEAEQRYALKEIEDSSGTRLPSIGLMIEW